MQFVSLHHHSTFSYLDGFGMPESHARRAAELGMSAFALTEHGNVSSHVKLEKAAIKHGIKPIFGCEFYCGDVSEEKRTQRKNHLTVLASNLVGYQNLLQLVSKGWKEGFYYEPTISGQFIQDHANGLVVLSGCTGSLLATSVIGGKNIEPSKAGISLARPVVQRFKRTFGDAYYIETQAFPELENVRQLNPMLAQLAEEFDIPLVATLDVHYTQPTESEIQQILHNVRGGGRKSLEEQAREWGYNVPLCPPISDQEIYDRLRGTGLTKKQAQEAIANTAEIASRCNVTLPKLDNLRYPLPPDCPSADVLFRGLIEEGWRYRSIPAKENWGEYKARLKHEMALIESKGFIDYFLVVSDAVRFAKSNGIPVGPARGSAAASLVCFLLRITEVDPMLFPTLLFERFIDQTRNDLPDIDLDFDDERRSEIRDYLVCKYGNDRIGNIGTFTRYHGRSALDDVARAHKIRDNGIEKVKELLVDRPEGDPRIFNTIEDTVAAFPEAKRVFEQFPQLSKAGQLEGNVRGFSTHAAGIVLANGPLTEVCAIYARKNSNGELSEVTSLDKYDAEYLNVMKLDVLGLKTMAMIRICLELTGLKLEDLYKIPLDDPQTLQGFRDNDLVGIFQFDGRAMRQVNEMVVPETFDEIADINALSRPGPLHGGGTARYVDVKFGRLVPETYCKEYAEITKNTHYQIVYQEQILKICGEIGGFTIAEKNTIRKLIQRKLGEAEFNSWRDKFVTGAATRGIVEEHANSVFDSIITAGMYAFNAAHSYSYGILAFWTMYLKQRYPLEFFTACLIKYEDKVTEIAKDALRHGITIARFDPYKSGETWTIADGTILPGFTQIPGIGPKIARKCVLHRRFGIGEIPGVGEAKLKLIAEFAVNDDPVGIAKSAKRIGDARGWLKGQRKLPPVAIPSSEIPSSTLKKDFAVVWVGQIKRKVYKDLFTEYQKKHGKPLDRNSVRDPQAKDYVLLVGEDETGECLFTIDRRLFPLYKKDVRAIKDDTIVVIQGLKAKHMAKRLVFASKLWLLEED